MYRLIVGREIERERKLLHIIKKEREGKREREGGRERESNPILKTMVNIN